MADPNLLPVSGGGILSGLALSSDTNSGDSGADFGSRWARAIRLAQDQQAADRLPPITYASALTCMLPDGRIVPYRELGNGLALIEDPGRAPQPGAGMAVGNAVNEIGMPTVDKPGGIAGGGASGRVTSPASGVLRGIFGGARFDPLRALTGTTSIGGSIARGLPLVGTLLMALDAAALARSAESAPTCSPIA